jgi:putative phosphoribosyl transferase
MRRMCRAAIWPEPLVLDTPREFFAVGQFYQDFAQVSDAEVKSALSETNARTAAASASAV